MIKDIFPSIFLGKLTEFDTELGKQYFQTLREYFKAFKDNYFVIVETSSTIPDSVYEISFDASQLNKDVITEIKKSLQDLSINPIERNSFQEPIQKYIAELQLPSSNIICLTFNETNPQRGMDIGHRLQFVRQKNCILIGLGNITHIDSKPAFDVEPIREFDSWVRVKLWEFDYYALRDIENFFPFERSLYLDNYIHYIPFLVIFGSLQGTDVLADLFTGFENLCSIRSFLFSSV